MAKPLTLRIAIADGEHARFVQPDSNNVLRTLHAFELGVRASPVQGYRFRSAGPGI